jgi:hypothetical protein
VLKPIVTESYDQFRAPAWKQYFTLLADPDLSTTGQFDNERPEGFSIHFGLKLFVRHALPGYRRKLIQYCCFLKPIPPAYGIGARRDEHEAAEFIRSALVGLLAANADYDADSLSFREALEDEELLDRAETLGLDAFGRWKAWRKHQRAIQALRTNPKVTLK